MIRGIRFKIEQNYGWFLCDLFKSFNLDKYNFILKDTNIHGYDNNRLINLNEYSGRDFKNLICNSFEYKIYCAIIQISEEKDFKFVNNYIEFINSKLNLIILIYDYSYVDVYCKNKNEIELLINNIKKINIEDFEEITDDNDERVGMYV